VFFYEKSRYKKTLHGHYAEPDVSQAGCWKLGVSKAQLKELGWLTSCQEIVIASACYNDTVCNGSSTKSYLAVRSHILMLL